MLRSVLLVLAGLLVLPGPNAAASGPVPPCAGAASPAPPGPGLPPEARSWSRRELGLDWQPPSCSGWVQPGFRSLVAVSGSFRLPGGMPALLTRFGAVSHTVGTRYWSVTAKRWETLIVAAFATEAGQRRPDFSVSEITPGRDFTYSQTDNGSGAVQYRFRVLALAPRRVVIETENLSTMRRFLIPLFGPGDVQALYVLDQQQAEVWTFYSLTRTRASASRLTEGHDASAINRAVAFYRYVAGLPTDAEPPAAP